MSLTRTRSEEATVAAEPQHQSEVTSSGLYFRSPVSAVTRAPSLVSSGDFGTGSGSFLARPQVQSKGTVAPPRSVQNMIALAFRTCREAIERAAASRDDGIVYANAMADLRSALGRLWDQRKYRERSFAGFINVLQLLTAGEQTLSSDQLSGMNASISVVTRYSKVSKADYRAALEQLQRAGSDIASILE